MIGRLLVNGDAVSDRLKQAARDRGVSFTPGLIAVSYITHPATVHRLAGLQPGAEVEGPYRVTEWRDLPSGLRGAFSPDAGSPLPLGSLHRPERVSRRFGLNIGLVSAAADRILEEMVEASGLDPTWQGVPAQLRLSLGQVGYTDGVGTREAFAEDCLDIVRNAAPALAPVAAVQFGQTR